MSISIDILDHILPAVDLQTGLHGVQGASVALSSALELLSALHVQNDSDIATASIKTMSQSMTYDSILPRYNVLHDDLLIGGKAAYVCMQAGNDCTWQS